MLLRSLLILLLATPAFAQTAEQDAAKILGQQIGVLTLENISLLRQLQAAKAEIDALKEKIGDAKPKEKSQ